MFRKLFHYFYSGILRRKKMASAELSPGRELKEQMLCEINTIRSYGLNDELASEVRVHEIRKSLKRIRALLKLLKPNLPERTYYRLDKNIGKAASSLTLMRESAVNLRTFIELFQKNESALPSALSQKIINSLTDQVNAAYKMSRENFHSTLVSLGIYMNKFERSLSTLRVNNLGRAELINTIDKSYIKSVQAYRDAMQTLDTEIIHSWRKQAKTLLIQLKYAPHKPVQQPESLINKLDHLTELLGKEHDLAVLEEVLYNNMGLEKEERQKIHLLVSKSRAKLKKQAFESGKMLFSQEVLQTRRAGFTA